jgi:type VI protein secretion system component VasK
VSVTLDAALPAGPWQARLVMRSGRIEKAVEATITFPAAGQVGLRVTAEPVPLAQNPSIVIPIAIGLLALAILLLLWSLWRRRRKNERNEAEPVAEPVVPAARRSTDEAVRK